MTTAASTSALEPCVPESIAPRSSAEASRALERCPQPSQPSPEPQPVAREECPACYFGAVVVDDERFGQVFGPCEQCQGTGFVTAKRGSEQGSNQVIVRRRVA